MARAVLFHGAGRPFEVVDVREPEPRGAEVLVRVARCALCRSDLHTHAGRRAGPTPVVLGHEVVGRVAAFGPDADHHDHRGEPLSVGTRVSWAVAVSCGRCSFCTGDLPQKCETLFKYGHARATPEDPFVGGLADVVLLRPGSALFRVPDALPDAVAASANCATATAAAVLRHGAGGAVAGKTLLILGAGVLGLSAAAMARVAGAAAVFVADPDPVRRARSISFGATRALAIDSPEPEAGADIVLELAGTADAVAVGLARTRVGGTLVLAGTVLPTPPVALDPEAVVRRMTTLRGVHNYAPRDLGVALDFLAGPGRAFPFAALVDKTFPLDEVASAFAHAHAHPGGRVVVAP